MPTLTDLSTEDADLIAGLPYRVGLWAGRIDPEGTSKITPEEIAALEDALAKAAAKHDVTGQVARATAQHKNRWPAWGDALETVPADCVQARQVLSGALPADDERLYCRWLLAIATSVAGAHGEFDTGEALGGPVGEFFSKISEGRDFARSDR